MIILFAQVLIAIKLEVHYEITVSALSLEAVHDETACLAKLIHSTAAFSSD